MKKNSHENLKKLASKVAHNLPATIFSNNALAAQTAQKQKSRTPQKPLNAGLGI